MREEYDISKSRRNPYPKRLKRQISVRLDVDTIAYFKSLSEQTGIPYQNLIDIYPADAAAKRFKPELVWQESR